MNRKRFFDILDRCYHNSATPAERDEWLAMLESGLYELEFHQWMERQYSNFQPGEKPFSNARELEQLERILAFHETERPSQRATVPLLGRRWLGWAAAIGFVLLTIGVLIWRQGNEQPTALLVEQAPIVPGSNKATLTLADGQVVELSGQQQGIVLGDDIRYDDGSILMENEQLAGIRSVDPHVISTQKGGQYQITLPDGTRVWLNAASTLRYPSRFNTGQRIVELEGEAYFDVSRMPNDADPGTDGPSHLPFLVKTKGQIVEVLGTQFNVQAYADEENTKTTLVSGTVQVQVAGTTMRLSPGEQSVWSGTTLIKQSADVSSATAWRNGLFSFDGDDIESVMNKLARWYDVEIDYEGSQPLDTFGGSVSRFENIEEVLGLLERTGRVRFQLTGRRVTVME